MKITEKYIQLAEEMGAADCVDFNIEDIEFDPRTILKCMYGCSDWGKGNTCPSRDNNLSIKEYKQTFEKYSYGVIIHCHDKYSSQKILLEIERRAFLDGYYFAFSLSDCGLCKECAGCEGEDCRFPKQARPAFHSVGIDVFKTVRKFNLPIATLKDENDEQNWYSAVFIE